MLCTFIIPSYNGAKRILNCIESIRKQTIQPHEIIVVVDGSDDDTEEILKPLEKEIKVLVQSNKGRAITRNNGARMANGELLFFVDDDIRIPKGTLQSHIQHHKAQPESVLVGKVKMDQSKIKTDFGRYLNHLFEKWDKQYEKKLQINEKNLKFTTQHLSLPRQLFQQAGGFDERLTDGEDYDFGMKVLEQNIGIFYDPAVIAYHDDFPTCEKYIKRQIEYKLSHQKLVRLGKVYKHDLFPEMQKPSLVRGTLCRLFLNKKWIYLADREFFKNIPEKIRFRIYAEIIFAQTLKGLGFL